MKAAHTEVGRINGRGYRLVHTRMRDQGAYKSSEWRWFAWTEAAPGGDEYVGDFARRHEALAAIAEARS